MARGLTWAAAAVLLCGVACAGSSQKAPGGNDAGADPPDSGPPDASPCADCFPLRPSPIAAENQLTGTKRWRTSRYTSDLGLYAARTSYAPGEAVEIRAAAGGATSGTWELFRVGYYGGAGGRLILSGGAVAVQQRPPTAIDPVTGAASAPWAPSFTFSVPEDAVTGVYVVKLTVPQGDSEAIFVVREKTPAATILYPLSTNTYQAYNTWGGTSLYQNRIGWKPAGASATPWHAYAVSFDRPYESGNGTGEFLSKDRDFVVFAEAQGYDIGYATETDVDADPSLAARRRFVAFQGHSEYWTKGMRDAVEATIARGTNVGFFAANDAYWQVRFADDSRRLLVGYKQDCKLDPMTKIDASRASCMFRDPVVGRPENAMIGAMYGHWIWAKVPLEVLDSSHWLWSGANVDPHAILPGVYGVEVDQRFDNAAEPAGVTVVAQGMAESYFAGYDTAQTTIYTAPSGATVFSAGSIAWSKTVANDRMWDVRIQQLTANLFSRFAGDGTLPAPLLTMALPPRKPPAFRAGVQVSTVTRELTQPTAVAVTPAGDAVVADGNRIVRVTPSGAVSVVAGSATAGAQDGPAAQALFNGPRGVAVAPDGAIYVSDTGNHRIRVVQRGIVSTIAGIDEGFAEGQGSAARFAQPMAIALLPSGNLLVADSWNMRLRVVTPSGAVTTLAGNGANSVTYGPGATASLSYPMAVAALPDGGALVAEAGTGLVRRVSSSPPHAVQDVAGRVGLDGWEDGPLARASVSETVSLAVRASDGLVLLLDSASARVRAISSGEVITLAGGTRGGCVDGGGGDAGFTAPRAIAIAPDGSALVVDAKEHALRRISGF